MTNSFENITARYWTGLIMINTWLAALALIGAVKLVHLVAPLACLFYDTLVPKNRLAKYRAPGAWAVVTGATAGIGEQFVHQLSAKGFKVLLISRTQSKLDEVASKVNGFTATFQLDAVTAGPLEYKALAKFTSELDGPVTVLVNNLGQSHEMPVPFSETPDEEMRQIIQVNNVATLEITRALLPSLEKGESRSLILTMGSFAGAIPTPMLATYAGSKGFLQSWNNALAAELQPRGIDAQLIVLYLVPSNISKIRRSSWLIPSPKNFVSATLNCVGLRGGTQERAYTMNPYWSHALMYYAIESTVGVWSALVAKINLQMHVGIRQRALRAKERKRKAD